MLMRRVLTVAGLAGILVAGLAAGPAGAVPPPGPASAAYDPTPASGTPLGTVCRDHRHAHGRDRVCASVHLGTDAVGNRTLRAAGAVASYDRQGRRVARPLALRVVLVGDRTGLRRAPPLYTIRRSRLGPERITAHAQTRVLAFVYRDSGWKRYLVYSTAATIH
jgi:hypothetical protein